MEQIDNLDDWQMVNVFFRPPTAESAKKGYYWPLPPRMQEGDLLATRFVYFRLGKQNGVPIETIRRGWKRYKMVLLYGIEGKQVSSTGALRSVMAERGELPEAIEEACQARRAEMGQARRKMVPEGHFG